MEKPCNIRSVSLRLQNEGQKSAHGLSPMHTESLTTDSFFDFFFLIYIWIKNGFASDTACGWFLTTRFVEDPLTKGK